MEEINVLPEKTFNYSVMILNFFILYVLIYFLVTQIYTTIVYGILKIDPCNFNKHNIFISLITIVLDLLISYVLGKIFVASFWEYALIFLLFLSFIPNVFFGLITRGIIGGVTGWNYEITSCASYCPKLYDQGCHVIDKS